MRKKRKFNLNTLGKISLFIFIFFIYYLLTNKLALSQYILKDILPYYTINKDYKRNMISYLEQESLNSENSPDEYKETSNQELMKNLEELEINMKTDNKEIIDLINTKNVEYKSNEYYSIENQFDEANSYDMDNLSDINYLKNNFYIVDEETDISSDLFDINKFLSANLSIKRSKEPKVLIFNTHGNEIYKDSSGLSQGVQGLNKELGEILENKYGILSIHNYDQFDNVHGKTQILGAYERMSPVIENILKENPSIEMVIDIHRDGLPEDVHLTTEINGKETAQIMLVNGLSKKYENGILKDISSLPNPNRENNLALSLRMKLNGNEMYPNFMRKIYLHAYRYSLHMKPLSLLVEVGAQNNTYEEAKNAMEPLADIIASVVLD